MSTTQPALFAMLFAASAACVATSSSTAGEAAPAAGEVTFELAGPGEAALVVPVHINGQGPFPFVLDTGATLTCVDEQLRQELSLPEATGAIGLGGGIRGMGSMQLVEIDRVQIGDASMTGLRGCAIDLAHVQKAGVDMRGLVGLNFLKSYRVTLDFGARTLRLDPLTAD